MNNSMMDDSMMYEQPDEYSSVEPQKMRVVRDNSMSNTSVAPIQIDGSTFLGSVTNTARGIVNMSLFSVVMLILLVNLGVLARFMWKNRKSASPMSPEWKMQFFTMSMLLLAGAIYSGASISQEQDNDKQRQQILVKLYSLGYVA